MKKNNMLRIASVLLVAVLLSTCAISGAFAKYTTSGTASDSARVALFGVEVEGTGNAFGTKYVAGQLANSVVADDSSATVSVNATLAQDSTLGGVVAPGTKGKLAALTISGTPEVDVAITYSAEVTLNGWEITWNEATAEYCPIKVYVNDGAAIVCDGDLDAFVAAIKAAVSEKSEAEVKAGTNMNTIKAPVITWEWAFTDSTDGLATDNDKKDTLLAEQSVYTSNTIEIAVTATVTQID